MFWQYTSNLFHARSPVKRIRGVFFMKLASLENIQGGVLSLFGESGNFMGGVRR